MGLATDNHWSGGLRGAVMDGTDIWPAVLGNLSTPHPEILHYLDVDGNMAYQSNMVKSLIIVNESFVVEPQHKTSEDHFPEYSCLACEEPNYLLLPLVFDDDYYFWAAQDESSTIFIIIFSFLLLSTLLLTLSLIVRHALNRLHAKQQLGSYSSDNAKMVLMSGIADNTPIECDVGEDVPLLYNNHMHKHTINRNNV